VDHADFRRTSSCGYVFPHGSGLPSPVRRISQVPNPSLAARHPRSPWQAAPVLTLIASRRVLASPSLAAWPPATCVSRLFPVQSVTAYGSPYHCRQLPTLRSGFFRYSP